MFRKLCRSKIHQARVTEANLHYEGSISIAADLMREADLLPYEEVHVWNLNNGERFTTYCIEAEAGSGTFCVNGAAARRVCVGDVIIVTAFAYVEEAESQRWEPAILIMNERNEVVKKLPRAFSLASGGRRA